MVCCVLFYYKTATDPECNLLAIHMYMIYTCFIAYPVSCFSDITASLFIPFFNILQTTTRYYSRYIEQLWIRKRLYSLMNLKRRVFLSKSNFIYKRKQNSFLKVWVEYLSLSMTQKKYTAISWFWLSIYYRESFCESHWQRRNIKNEEIILSKVKGLI